MNNNNNIWWEEHSRSFTSVCVDCDDTDVFMSDKVLTEMIQKSLIKPEDLARINEPDFPEQKKQLIMTLLNK
jgi:hypothetical protein